MAYKGSVLYDADQMIPLGTTPHGSCYISTPAATTVTNAGTFYLLQGTTSPGVAGTTLFTHASPGRLTYNGTVTKPFLVATSISFISSANNVIVKVRIAKNGTTTSESEQQFFLTTGADVKSISTHSTVSLATNDYVEVYVTCDSAGATVTSQSGNMFVNEV